MVVSYRLPAARRGTQNCWLTAPHRNEDQLAIHRVPLSIICCTARFAANWYSRALLNLDCAPFFHGFLRCSLFYHLVLVLVPRGLFYAVLDFCLCAAPPCQSKFHVYRYHLPCWIWFYAHPCAGECQEAPIYGDNCIVLKFTSNSILIFDLEHCNISRLLSVFVFVRKHISLRSPKKPHHQHINLENPLVWLNKVGYLRNFPNQASKNFHQYPGRWQFSAAGRRHTFIIRRYVEQCIRLPLRRIPRVWTSNSFLTGNSCCAPSTFNIEQMQYRRVSERTAQILVTIIYDGQLSDIISGICD